MLKRNLYACPSHIKDKCYKTLVRPIVEYSSTVWDPTTKKCIDKIEMVQRRAARFVKGDYRTTSSVTKMMKQLQWQPLQQRRKAAKAVMMNKILKKEIEIPSDHLVTSNSSHRTRGHQQRLVVPRSRINSHIQSFFPSATRIWNGLPQEVVNCSGNSEMFRERVQRLGELC